MNEQSRKRASSDEHYLIDICDRLLQRKELRQRRSDFLLGDPGKDGRKTKLPVDAYYPDLSLVVEVMERQHSDAVAFFDRPSTVSGVPRVQQRRLYDQRRREIQPRHDLQLVYLGMSKFAPRAGKLGRLNRSRRENGPAELAGLFTTVRWLPADPYRHKLVAVVGGSAICCLAE